jgi:pimeloyl-ACP methyl ester carboxylesterase
MVSSVLEIHWKPADVQVGTYLGATFAAMFPNRVGRMVLDGVVDASHAHDPFFSSNIRDTDAVYDLFFEYCAQAGPSECDFAREGDDARTLRNRANTILDQLQEHSLVGVQPRSHTPLIFTWSILHSASFGILYSPVLLFPILARIYDLLYREDYDEVFASISQLRDRINPCAFCSEELTSSFDTGDASTAIRCADAAPLDASIAELDVVFQNLSKTSMFADVYMGVGLQCNTWPIRPATPPLPLFNGTAINTSFPLLFVSNTFDPVTPLRNGVAMANLFKGAALVEQQGEGHCSIAEVSLCTINKIRGYLQDGEVPYTLRNEKGTVEWWEKCEVDERPWKPFQDDVAVEELGYGKQDVEVVEAWKEVRAYLLKQQRLRPWNTYIL